MNENRLYAVIWTVCSGFALAAIFLISSCQIDQNTRTQQFAQRCVASGHKFVDTDKMYGMCL